MKELSKASAMYWFGLPAQCTVTLYLLLEWIAPQESQHLPAMMFVLLSFGIGMMLADMAIGKKFTPCAALGMSMQAMVALYLLLEWLAPQESQHLPSLMLMLMTFGTGLAVVSNMLPEKCKFTRV